MKKFLLLLATVLTATLAVQADVTINSTNFPDANFRSYLLSEYPSGVITTAQLNARTTLEVGSKNISNLKGVEYFTELTRLYCFDNNLTTVDVSHNTKLTNLNLGYNKLTSINVSANTELEHLYLQYNQLTSVTVTSHSKLYVLWLIDNPNLTSLNCHSNNLTNFDISGCTALQTLKCYYNDNLTTIKGLADCTALTYLDCEDCAITELPGVNNMNNLQTLWARNNKLSGSLYVTDKSNLNRLRVSGNTQLEQLYCYSCNLTSLNVSGCTGLENLRCYYNDNLTEITGLADCTALTYLDCEDCAITDLPGVNNMPNLRTLWARYNQLSGSLTVQNKPNLQNLRVKGNTGLTEIRCDHNALTSLDVTDCTGLTFIDCEVNPSLTSITGLTTCTALVHFGCDYCAFTSLDMTFCPDLQVLYCYNNQLTSLNVTGLTNMVFLNCMNNPNLGEITGLSDCTAITYLECSNCGLTSLYVDNMDNLQQLWCRNNQMTELYVENKPNLTTLYATNNPLLEDLTCYFNALVQLEVSNCPALINLDCRYNKLSTLNVSTCPALMYLFCDRNQLTGLNVSNNPELAYLWCNSNQLTDLDISNNPGLVSLWCNKNELTSLDLSHCSDELFSLDCRNNHITGTIDVSRFAELFQLAIARNEISQLVLGNHPELKDLWCEINQLSGTLDVSGFSALQTLDCAANHFAGVRADGCTKLHDVEMYLNSVKSPQMGQFVADLPTWPTDSMGDLFVINTQYEGYTEGNVMTVAQVNEAHAKGWNVYYFNEDDEEWQPYAGSTFQRGDVNDDGVVNIGDVTALIKYLLSHDADGVNLSAADCDQNNNVTIGDVTTLIKYLLSQSWPDSIRAAATSPAKTSPANSLMPVRQHAQEMIHPQGRYPRNLPEFKK